jgi:hypothetical protein
MGTSKKRLIFPDFVSWLHFIHNLNPFSILFFGHRNLEEPLMADFHSCGHRCPVFRQPDKVAHVADQVHHCELGSGPGNANRANQLAAHGAFLESEDMLDTGPDLRAGVLLVKKIVEDLAVMNGGVGDPITARQIVAAVHVHMVLVAEVTLAVLLGPAGVHIF